MQTLLASDVDKAQLGSLLKILAVLILKLRGQRIKEDLKPVADSQLKAAKAFVKKIGADVELFDDLYNNILKKSDVVQPFADAFVKNLRKRIRETNLFNNLDNITVKQKEVINYILTLISTPSSASAYSSLQRRISNLGDNNINKRYIEHHTQTGSTPAAIKDQIERLVYNMTGRKNSMALTADENKKWADNDTKKEIGKLRSAYSEAVRQTVKQIVLDSGKSHILIAQVMKKLKEMGTGVTPYPSAFSTSKHIYVDLNAALCNINGDVLAAKSMSPTFKFELNQAYDPDAVGKGKGWLYKVTSPETGNANYIGTVVKSAVAKGAKFEKLTDILSSGEIDNIKKRWRKQYDPKNMDSEDSVYSMLTEFIYNTSSRIGSEAGGGNTGGVKTFGASNFPRSSVSLPSGEGIPAKLKIKYVVKGGHSEQFLIDPTKSNDALDKTAKQKLIEFIVKKAKGKKPSDPLFTIGSKPIQATAYTNWLKAHTTLTAHNFRTLRGSEVALTILPDATKQVMRLKASIKPPKKLADKTVHEIFKEAMTKVGKILGHIRRTKDGVEESTANTAISYYVNPTIMLDWYAKVGYSPVSGVIAAARRANIDI